MSLPGCSQPASISSQPTGALHTGHGGFALETWQLTTMAGGALDARAFTHALTKYLSRTPRLCVVSVTEGLTVWHKARLGGLPCSGGVVVVVGCHVAVKKQLKKLHQNTPRTHQTTAFLLSSLEPNKSEPVRTGMNLHPLDTHAHINKSAVTVFVAVWQHTKRAVSSVLRDII